MCEIYGFCGVHSSLLNKYTDRFWRHSNIHKDGFGYFLADKDDYYVNKNCAMDYINNLTGKKFVSKLALCHIRFKTHGPVSTLNCHPFIKYDCHNVRWSLIHNGYISDNLMTSSLKTIQKGETDSERILLSIVETVNNLYEHSFFKDKQELQYFLNASIENTLSELATLGKTNLIFTDDRSNNMYVYMNAINTLYYLKTQDGYHFSTVPLTDEPWNSVEPFKLHVFNNGALIN